MAEIPLILINTAFTQMGNAFNQVFSAMTSSSMLQIIGIVIIIGKCIFLAFNFFITAVTWFFSQFIPWLFKPWPPNFLTPKHGDKKYFAGFIPWLIRYIIVIITQIINLPKCFLWYALDTMGWIIYLPFRITFWTLDYLFNTGIVQQEHNLWNFFAEIDYYIRGPDGNFFIKDYDNVITPDPNSLNLGLHIIHFPDNVMRQCYSIDPFSLDNIKGVKKVMKSFTSFVKCATNPF